jgi:hypothetical protein
MPATILPVRPGHCTMAHILSLSESYASFQAQSFSQASSDDLLASDKPLDDDTILMAMINQVRISICGSHLNLHVPPTGCPVAPAGSSTMNLPGGMPNKALHSICTRHQHCQFQQRIQAVALLVAQAADQQATYKQMQPQHAPPNDTLVAACKVCWCVSLWLCGPCGAYITIAHSGS